MTIIQIVNGFSEIVRSVVLNMLYQFWQQDNHPIELINPEMFQQKLHYIHNNPVEEGFVVNSFDYKYSSARNYAELDAVLEIDKA